MSHLLLTHSSIHPLRAPSHRSRASGVHLNLGPTSALLLMMLLIGLMGLISLTHLNSMSTKGYSINKLEDDYSELVSDGELNDMMILQARSMQTVEQSTQVQAMVKPDHVYYMESISGFAQVGQ